MQHELARKYAAETATGSGRNKICTNCQLAATCRVSGQDDSDNDNDNNKLGSGTARAHCSSKHPECTACAGIKSLAMPHPILPRDIFLCHLRVLGRNTHTHKRQKFILNINVYFIIYNILYLTWRISRVLNSISF